MFFSSPFKATEANTIFNHGATQDAITPIKTGATCFPPSTPGEYPDLYARLRENEAMRLAALSPERARGDAARTPLRRSWFAEQEQGDEGYAGLFASPLPAWMESPSCRHGLFNQSSDPIMELAPPPFASGSSAPALSRSGASPMTPVSEASNDEGNSEDMQVEDGMSSESDGEAVEVTNPTVSTTFNIHPQSSTAGGRVAATDLVILPFPENRDELFDFMLDGLFVNCVLPSSRSRSGRIICEADASLDSDGEWVGHKICGESSSTEDIYRRHMLSHFSASRFRNGQISKWIHEYRPDSMIRRGDPKKLVFGARPKQKDTRVRN